MIGHFPTLYPDELLYSLLARHYVKTGYLAYTYAAEELYVRKTNKPNIEFINRFTPDAMQLLTRTVPFAQIIEKHTMMPYYVRFLDKDRRSVAVQKMLDMDEAYYGALCIPKAKQKNIRYLRYCPMCAAADRRHYGETYWHRNHQMTGCNICTKHFCQLVSSGILINSVGSPSFITAEETIPKTEAVTISENRLERQVAQYLNAVFQEEIDLETDIPVGRFLHSKMEGTPYLSQRGKQRNFTLLHNELMQYYGDLAVNLRERWKLEKVLTSDRINTYDICLIALFLQVPAEELTQMKLPEQTQQQIFDSTVKNLHEQGLNYRQIANRMQASYDVVKSIGAGNYGRKGGRA